MSDNLKERLADMSALSQSKTPADALKYIEELEAKLAKAVEALEFYTYETTHLSAEEDDGSHWCKISKGCLAQARTTLAELKGEK